MQETPAWVKVKVWPAMVIVPLREVVEVLAVNEKLTVPLPELLPPAVTVIQAAPLLAVQEHPLPEVTPTLPLPAVEATEALAGEIAYVQGAPACVTVKVCPATVMVSEREVVDVFAATE